jgi:hypothetical protein
VTYDLVDRSGSSSSGSKQPTAVPEPVSVATAAGAAVQHSSSSHAGTRFETLVDFSTITGNISYVCGATPAPSDPWVIGSLTNRSALIFLGNTGSCSTAPTVLTGNNLSYAGVWVRPLSWLSLTNLLPAGVAITGQVGSLTMDATSILEAVFPSGYVPSPYVTVTYNLLRSTSACPSFTNVNFTVANCPFSSRFAPVGQYACFLTSTPGLPTCSISLAVTGALSFQANQVIAATLARDCSTMTQATMKSIIEAATGIPSEAILVTYWQCASIIVYLTVLGGSVGQASIALNTIYVSMVSGVLRSALGVVSVSIGIVTSPAANLSYTTVTVNYPYSYPYVLPYLVPYSSSNPGLFALLTLLIIPVGVVLALLLWCACRPVKRAVLPPCPCPCPAPYMPMPMCMPDPCPPPVVCDMQPMCTVAPMPCEPMYAPMMGSGTFSGNPTF